MSNSESLLQRRVVRLFLAYMVVAIPFYAYFYGALNFLYVCDVALLVTLVAELCNSRPTRARLFSAALCGILVPQGLWIADFVVCFFQACPDTALSSYLFNPHLSTFLRGLSLFHIWLPFYLYFRIMSHGYHVKAWRIWSIIAALDLIVCFFVSPPPGGSPELPRNINKVFGPDDDSAQAKVNPMIWLFMLIIFGPLVIYLPTHKVLSMILPAYSKRVR